MLIVGDIGGTDIRLALVSPAAGPRQFLEEQEFHSADFNGLQLVVEVFLAKTGVAGRRVIVSVVGWIEMLCVFQEGRLWLIWLEFRQLATDAASVDFGVFGV